ncbi:polycomb group protein Psc [Glossina fuscipes]|uniref:Polycomb group protein Psc n=1 Tax=Glossina fuscipes TaxID=7396 RepID=A0A9C6DQJ6_9MUSC|nr:polycomb group protein Psc [Glossina fuscipes]
MSLVPLPIHNTTAIASTMTITTNSEDKTAVKVESSTATVKTEELMANSHTQYGQMPSTTNKGETNRNTITTTTATSTTTTTTTIATVAKAMATTSTDSDDALHENNDISIKSEDEDEVELNQNELSSKSQHNGINNNNNNNNNNKNSNNINNKNYAKTNVNGTTNSNSNTTSQQQQQQQHEQYQQKQLSLNKNSSTTHSGDTSSSSLAASSSSSSSSCTTTSNVASSSSRHSSNVVSSQCSSSNSNNATTASTAAANNNSNNNNNNVNNIRNHKQNDCGNNINKNENSLNQTAIKVEDDEVDAGNATTTTTAATATITTTITTTTTTTPAKQQNSSSKNNAAAIESVCNESDSTEQLLSMKPSPVLLSAVNPHIICSLCFGYLIDATTIVECLHSFCHSCLIKHLRTQEYCPRCEMVINTVKPNIKSDTTLQAIVYKLVPSLYEKELMRKRAFYKDRPEEAALATPEQRGDDTEHLIFSPSDYMSLSLEYADIEELNKYKTNYNELLKPRYVKCPAMFTVAHLKKFVYGKFQIDANRFFIDIMYKVKTIVLLDHYTLMDVAYIYTWKRDAPMRFYFRVKKNLKPLLKVKKNLLNTHSKTSLITTTIATTTATATEITTDTATDTNNKILEPAEIKVEDEAEVSSTTETPSPETKHFQIVQPPQSPSTSSQESHTADSLKITLVSKPSKDKTANCQPNNELKSMNLSKLVKEKRENLQVSSTANTPSTTTAPKEERKVENIKLKIDLSKQNSVTIINMSDPERKEIVKPVRPDKEWKVKNKKDKDTNSPKPSPKSSPHNERKSKTPSPLTVPPLTIKAERISPLAKYPSANSPRSNADKMSEEEKKSQFLKSFSLTPIKDIKQEKFDDENDKKQSLITSSSKINAHKVITPTVVFSSKLPTPLPPIMINQTGSKRKCKDPVKTVVKKPKISPPMATEDFKIKLPPICNSTNANHSDKAVAKSPAAISAVTNPPKDINDKPLMPPPIGLPMMRPLGIASRKAQKPSGSKIPATSPGSLIPHPHIQGIQMSAPGNRTPIAKRYQHILPKAARPNPFANIPSDVNKILKEAGTEIKTILNDTNGSKVYGPKSETTTLMGPPPLKTSVTKTQASPCNVTQQHNSPAHNAKSTVSQKSNNSNSYLNLALFNTTKAKGNEVPPGCRTPMYTPNSPIYSPNSPQYVPNYNIPTMPTYKYTPKPSSSSSNFLQNVLGSNSQMANLFPTPPVKKDSSNSNKNFNNTNTNNNNNNNNTNNSTSNNNSSNQQSSNKRSYPFVRSPSPLEDPPEKQLKVKSLLTSCNISIPSSLSITITREDSESATNNSAYPKHKSPVNNYIEILKLPDHPVDNSENKRSTPPSIASSQHLALQNNKNAQLFPNPPIKRDLNQSPNAMKAAANPALASLLIAQSNNNNCSIKTNCNANGPKSNNISNTNGPTKIPNNNQKLNNISKTPPAKTPSPEKKLSVNGNINSEQKSPKSPVSSSDGNSSQASKKFRHILPRQMCSSASESTGNTLPATKPTNNANNGNVIGTYASPNGIAIKIHSQKKVQPSKKSPGSMLLAPKSNLLSPNAPAATNSVKPPSKSPQNAKSINKPNNASLSAVNNTAPSIPSLPSLPISHPPPMPSMAVTMPNLPPHLGIATAAGQAELSKLFKENLFRAQVQAAAAANPSNMFYSYANAAAQMSQYTPIYNYQQAYIMEQLSRMRAGNEAFTEYMQKLKNSMEANNKTPAEQRKDNRIANPSSPHVPQVNAATPSACRSKLPTPPPPPPPPSPQLSHTKPTATTTCTAQSSTSNSNSLTATINTTTATASVTATAITTKDSNTITNVKQTSKAK